MSCNSNNSTGKSGEFNTIANLHVGNLRVKNIMIPAQYKDAFSRLRVSAPGYRFDSQLTYRIDPDLWDTKVTGDGTVAHDATNRLAILTAGATAGANTIDLSAAFTSSARATLTLIHDGTKWIETSRSIN